MAISYCSSEFLGMHGELVTDCYVFNLEHTTRPLVTFASPDHVTVLDYNDKNPSLLGGGCYRGQVGIMISGVMILIIIVVRCAGGTREREAWPRVRVSLRRVTLMWCTPSSETNYSGDLFVFSLISLCNQRWIGKTGHEFFTGSSDGFIKWWDIR